MAGGLGGGEMRSTSEVGAQRTPQFCGGGTENYGGGSLEVESALCWAEKM